MNITEHAQKRIQQRGKTLLDVLVIKRYGEKKQEGIYMLSRRRARRVVQRLQKWLRRRKSSASFSQRAAQVRHIIQSIEKTVNWMAIISEGGALVTIYPADRHRQRKFMRGKCRRLSNHNHKEG